MKHESIPDQQRSPSIPRDPSALVSLYPILTKQSAVPPLPTPSNPSHPLDIIGYSPFPPNDPADTTLCSLNSSSTSLRDILADFLFNDLTSKLPELVKWREWVKQEGYVGSRIILSDHLLHLLASKGNGDVDDLILPYGKRGIRQPELHRTFTSSHMEILTRMWACVHVSGGHDYCGYCPGCLRWETRQKLILNKPKCLRRLDAQLEELDELIQKGNVVIQGVKRCLHAAERQGFRVRVRKLREQVSRLERWSHDPAKYKTLMNHERGRLLATLKDKELQQNATLIQECHWLVSVCCPLPLHALFDVRDGWMRGMTRSCGRRASDRVKTALEMLEGMATFNRFTDVLRVLFRRLVVQTVHAQHPDIELTSANQLHPFNKWGNSPDLHFLICRLGQDRATSGLVEVSFDKQLLLQSLESAMLTLSEFALWASKHWHGGCRSVEFNRWRRNVAQGHAALAATGIAPEVLDIRLVPVRDLLRTYSYVRRHPMENVVSVFFRRKQGVVDVRYFKEPKRAAFGITDLMWRFVGFDGRGTRVEYTGAYKSVRGRKRSQKVSDFYDARKKMQEGSIEGLRDRLSR